jgi:hypothetical protein
MNRPLADAWAKYKRADAHADALHREISVYRESDTVNIVHDGDPETGEYVFRVELSEEPPLRRWGLTVGDILHNLHSALDSLAWQLAIAFHSHEPSESDARSIYFPLATSPQTFASYGVLKQTLPMHRAILQDVQPYQGGYGSLRVLSELSRRDKHRAIHPTYLVDDNFRVELEAIHDSEITGVVYPSPGPLENGRELARVSGRTTGPKPAMEGKANLTCHIALSDGTPLQGLIDDMGKAVGRVLRKFEPTLSDVLL